MSYGAPKVDYFLSIFWGKLLKFRSFEIALFQISKSKKTYSYLSEIAHSLFRFPHQLELQFVKIS